MRSEYEANRALSAQAPASWARPSTCQRPQQRRTYGCLSIARRHPGLFAALTRALGV